MSKVTILLNKNEEGLIKGLMAISGCKRYTAVKRIFLMGCSTVEFIAEGRQFLLKILQEQHSKTDKEVPITNGKITEVTKNGKEKQEQL